MRKISTWSSVNWWEVISINDAYAEAIFSDYVKVTKHLNQHVSPSEFLCNWNCLTPNEFLALEPEDAVYLEDGTEVIIHDYPIGDDEPFVRAIYSIELYEKKDPRKCNDISLAPGTLYKSKLVNALLNLPGRRSENQCPILITKTSKE